MTEDEAFRKEEADELVEAGFEGVWLSARIRRYFGTYRARRPWRKREAGRRPPNTWAEDPWEPDDPDEMLDA